MLTDRINGRSAKLFQHAAHSDGTAGGNGCPLRISSARLITEDIEALAIRLQVIESARSTLDLQYYYWLPDLAGRLLALATIRAADRGVKIRFLLDDLNAGGLDRTFAALDSHRNISVRLFNPLRFRKNGIARFIAIITTFVTANRRMHNKCLVADGKLAIVGGRNIGNAYFGVDEGTNFHDLDIAVSGQATAEAASIFDSYWNSVGSVRVSRLIGKMAKKLGKLRQRLEDEAASPRAMKLLRKIQDEAFPPVLETLKSVSSIEVGADPPEKAVMAKTEVWLGPRIETIIASAKKEVQILSPYFIPGLGGSEFLEEIAASGVKVRILTNCLAATDVVVAHSGYARYRDRLLAAGIELFEQPAKHRQSKARIFGSRKATLHTKAILVDGRKGFVGSFNFDPRSKSINTEMGVFFDDEQLGATLANELGDHLKHCLNVVREGKILVWRNRKGQTIWRGSEPFASIWRRLVSTLSGLLPIESQL